MRQDAECGGRHRLQQEKIRPCRPPQPQSPNGLALSRIVGRSLTWWRSPMANPYRHRRQQKVMQIMVMYTLASHISILMTSLRQLSLSLFALLTIRKSNWISLSTSILQILFISLPPLSLSCSLFLSLFLSISQTNIDKTKHCTAKT